MKPVVEFGRALDYPHIEFNSRRWLRTATLFHDEIGRVYPGAFRPPFADSSEVQTLREEVWKLEDVEEIEEWIDGGQTALCPHCGIYSVLPVIDGQPDVVFLWAMHRYWF
jgi:hypothetical protein